MLETPLIHVPLHELLHFLLLHRERERDVHRRAEKEIGQACPWARQQSKGKVNQVNEGRDRTRHINESSSKINCRECLKLRGAQTQRPAPEGD